MYATANDKAVEALGSGLDDDGTVLLSLGTYIAAMTIGSSSSSADGSYWANFAARPGKYLYESTGIRRGMWRSAGTAPCWRAARRASRQRRAARLEDALNAEASRLAPGSNGLLTLPDWLAPGHAAWRRGALLGFDGSQGRAHIYRSILEGIALTMANHTAAMEHALGRRLSPVLVSGGGSRSDLMMQIVADVFDRPARRTAVNDAAGLGAAICAAVGHGIYPGWDQATAAMVAAGERVHPGRTGGPRLPADQHGVRRPDQVHRPAVPLDGRRPGRPGPRVTAPRVLAPPGGAPTGPSASGRRGD